MSPEAAGSNVNISGDKGLWEPSQSVCLGSLRITVVAHHSLLTLPLNVSVALRSEGEGEANLKRGVGTGEVNLKRGVAVVKSAGSEEPFEVTVVLTGFGCSLL